MSDKKEIITVYITKYALTQGIQEKEVEIGENDKDVVRVIKTGTGFSVSELYFREGKEWHRAKESAIKRAEEMRLKKIKNFEKQIEKLKKMEFK